MTDCVLTTIPLPMDLEQFVRLLQSYAEDYPDARLGNDVEGNPIIITTEADDG